MARVKITKKDLKEDEIRTFGKNIVHYYQEHQKKILIALIALLVIMLGFKIHSLQKRRKIRDANILFSEASEAFQRGVMSADAQERMKHLENCVNTSKRIVQDYGSSPLSREALYLQASASFFKAGTPDQYDQPISLFNRYIERAQTEREKAIGYVGLGYSYENKYFLTDDRQILPLAMDAYQKGIELGTGTATAAEAKLCKGRLLELQRKDDEAKILYESVKKEREQKPLVSSLPPVEYRDAQMKFLNQQLTSMKNLFTYTKKAEFALQRIEGEE